MNIPTVSLPGGTKIPQLGLGLWMMKDEQSCRQAVAWALEAGYRHFDTAQIYGNEAFLGQALAEGKVSRDELFITTKIWNENLFWDDVVPTFEESLENLQTDYVDLLLVHFPVTHLRRPAWRKLEEIQRSGRAKAIGVSNYTVKHLAELLREGNLKPAVNQVELHVFLQQPELVAYCQKEGIVLEAYSPLAHGNGLDNPVLQAIADKHGVTTAQIMIGWTLQQGFVSLPKTAHKDRLSENLAALNLKLDDEDLSKIKGLDTDLRTCWDPTHIP